MNLIVALLVACGAIARASETCPPLCTCEYKDIQCRYTGRMEPPAGYWSNVEFLYLDGNNISDLHPQSFSGFPEVHSLALPLNAITVLDFEVYAAMPKLTKLELWLNPITSVVKPAPDLQLPSLNTLQLNNCKLTTLDPNLLASVTPKLKYLYMSNNPFVFPDKGPVFNHPELRSLTLDGSNATAVNPRTFSGLPNLRRIDMIDSGVRNITGAFLRNPKLSFAVLSDCNITQVVAGTFAPNRTLDGLWLSYNPLDTIELGAIEQALNEHAHVDLLNTPLVCQCKHADIYRWAKREEIGLFDTCKAAKACSFH